MAEFRMTRCAVSAALIAIAIPVAAQVPLAKLTPGNPYGSKGFGVSVCVSGDVALVGEPSEYSGCPPAVSCAFGAAFVYERQGSAWPLVATLVPADSYKWQGFGRSVAVSGDTAVIGASPNQVYAPGPGSAYVFERSSTGWVETAKLTGAGGTGMDGFGESVRIQADTVLVGAPLEDGWKGAVYVFERDAAGWVQTDRLAASDGAFSDFFGKSVSLDGIVIAIGAFGDDDGAYNSGAVYVFERSTAGWIQAAKLVASAPTQSGNLGLTVSVSGDRISSGTIALYPDIGAARVFERAPSGWVETALLVPHDAAPNDGFLMVSLDGDLALVGEWGDDELGNNAGAAYAFEKTPLGWVELGKLLPDGPSLFPWGEEFGLAVSLDATTAIIGEPGDNGIGAAHLFSICTPTHGTAVALLSGEPASISLSGGGTQILALETCPATHAGDLYLLLGSAVQNPPGLGVPVDGVLLPLTIDGYFLFALAHPNKPPLSGSFGALDADSSGAAAFTVPPGSNPYFAGIAVEHAYLIFDLGAGGVAVLASEVERVTLAP